MALMAAAAAVSVGSAVVGAIGSSKAAKAQKEAAKKQARLQRLQAAELIKRDRINRFLLSEQGEQAKSGQLAAYAKSGVDLGANSVLTTLEDTEAQILRKNYLSQTEANIQADLMRQGAASTEKAGNAIARAGRWAAVGQIFSGVSNAYMMNPKGFASLGGSISGMFASSPTPAPYQSPFAPNRLAPTPSSNIFDFTSQSGTMGS